MKIINPLTWSNTMMTSSSVTENDHPSWVTATSYSVGTRVIRTNMHKIYECLIAHTSASVSPENDLTGESPKWLEIGATNKYLMVDGKFGTQTTATTTLVVEVTPGKAIDSMALLNLLGRTVRVEAWVGAVKKYDSTITLQTDVGVYDWKTYFLAPIVAEDDVVITDLKPYNLQLIRITVTGVGTVAIGNAVFGSYVKLGETQYGAGVGIVDYSTKEFDSFGNITVVQRAYSKQMSCNIAVQSSFVDQLAGILASIRATPVVWVGADSQYSSLIIWGYAKDFSIDISYPTLSYCSLTIEGLI